MVQPLWKTMEGVTELNIDLPYDLGISLLGLYPKELKAGTQRDICTPIFITVLFTITKR